MRTRTPFWGAVCVGVCLLATGSLASAATISVPAGGNLQQAIDAAQPGDVILLEPGATYVGNFVLRNKGPLTDFITIRSAAPDFELPGPGIRMTPAYGALLPKIKSSNSMAALRTATSAHHWKLLFLEFQANYRGFGEIISLGAGDSTQTTESQVPYALVLDRVYVHGDPLFGQKRGIALNSRDTDIVNSYVSDCKAIGQDSQAIGGFNGPGNFRIENNYLEGAAENVLIGGSDPTIPDLVTTNITVRHNHMPKPLAWRNPIVATPAGASATVVASAGALEAGTYAYRVAARLTSNQSEKATSASSVEVSATIAAGTTGGVRVSWAAVVGAEEYLVYGRAAGGQTMYWKTPNTYFTDTGAAGTLVGSPSAIEKPGYAGTKWAVKNTFELKNAQDVVIEGNVFEYLWVADQTGYPIVFTPRNQNGRAPWTVVQRVDFRHNLVRHTAGGVNILGIDNLKPSQRTNTITITHNVFDDLTAATWGSGSRPFTIGDGPDKVTIDHNTVFSTNPQLVWLYGSPTTNSFFTNNMGKHNAYGIMANGVAYGNASISQFVPGVDNVTANVIAGGSASRYPPGNFFPPVPEWMADLPGHATGDYRLKDGSPYKNAGLDGKDLGADIDTLEKHVPIALSGKDDGTPVTIVPTTLVDGKANQPYAQLISCLGNIGACVFTPRESTLPAGITFDAAAGLISGVPLEPGDGSITIDAYDAARRTSVATLSLKVAPPDFSIMLPPATGAQVGSPVVVTPSVTGAIGATTWSIASGALPPGLELDSRSGVIAGVPATHGAFTVGVLARDSWTERRDATASAMITVIPAALSIDPATLGNAVAGTPYSAAFTATGGTGATVWALKNGSLPEGMTLETNGALIGTPTSPASFSFTVVATDAVYSEIHAETTLALTVDAPAPTEPPKPVREIVLYAADAAPVAGTWSIVPDDSAAGGKRVWNKDVAAPKLTTALASPANYFELTFNADAGVGYHLWLRGKAEKDSWANDSVFVQFSGSVNASGAAVNRIGTTSAAIVTIEERTNAGLAGWGWADDSYGGFANPMYFAATGTQTIRIQAREDGLSLDQIVLSADRFATRAPGATKNDTTILTTAAGDPTLTIDAVSLGNATYGAAYAATLSATGSTGSTNWSVVSGQLPEGMTLSAAGALNGTPASLGEFTFTVQAQDAAWQANVAAAPVTLTVVAPAFGVNAPAPSPAMVGQPYATAFTATGNVGGVAWTLASGDLPAGLTLDGVSGTVGGQPTAWGVFAALVQGADSLGRVESAPITIVVAPTPLTIAATTPMAAAYKTAYSAALAAEGGTGAVAWTVAAGSLPAGLALDASSGVISGIPTQAGNFVFDVRAVDINWEGDDDTRSITLEVQPPVFSAAIAPAAVTGRVGMPFQGLVGHAAGNVGGVKWSLVSGALPGGVALDSVAGTISGTPAAFGHFTAGIKAEDTWNASRFVVSTVTIEVAPIALAVVTDALASANVGQTYAATVAANGGTGLTTWRVSGGTLPAGVTLGANGAFSGTPTAAGTSNFTVEATDAGWAGNIATRDLTLAVGVREVVLYAAAATRVAGTWAVVADPSAAGGARVANPDAAAAKLSAALANPANYFELTFQAQAGVAYHLWLRGKADKNAWANDSVYVQFSGSVDANGNPVNRIGTTGAATVSIEDGTNAGLSGWGWSDDAYGGFGSAMYFATTGTHTVRIQVREDGVSLDQIVLSADRYATVTPGATKNDATILAR
jgi:hypothetical protein